MRTHYIIYRVAQLLAIAIFLGGIHACEEEYQPPDFYTGPTHVVEGRLEWMEGGSAQAIVLLNRDLPFWNAIGPEDLLRANVKNASVQITINGEEYLLRRICLNQLDATLRRLLAAQLGIDVELLEDVDYCVYWHPVVGIQTGDSAVLEIRIEDTVLMAKTVMPRFQALDTVYFVQRPFIDSFYELRIRLADADGPDYYRYFISVNGAAFRSFEHSVFNDWFFDGKSFELPLYNPYTTHYELTDQRYGLFARGDTVRLKWCHIDEEQFRFWQTVEYNRDNQGPFSSYTRVYSNVHNGLGYWGALHCREYELIAK